MGTNPPEAKMLQKLTGMREEFLYKYLFDLRKDYDEIYRERCTEIIVGYGVGPRTERILRYYWDHLSMVARKGHYYGTPFKGHQWFTQGDPLSPTIFKMVVDTVICHWVMLVVGEEAGTDAFGRAVQWLLALFYYKNGLLDSPRPAQIQTALDVLTGLFVINIWW